MRLDDLVLRCYAEQDQDGSWFTLCIDLNLYARGENFKEARQKLHEIIRNYLNDAVGKDARYVSDLIPRKAPLYFIARYYLVALRCWFGRSVHHSRDALHRCLFKEPFTVIVR